MFNNSNKAGLLKELVPLPLCGNFTEFLSLLLRGLSCDVCGGAQYVRSLTISLIAVACVGLLSRVPGNPVSLLSTSLRFFILTFLS